MPRLVKPPGSRSDGAVAPLSEDAFAISRLLLELVHATYASRGEIGRDAEDAAAAETAGPPDAAPPRPRVSMHAIRAAIDVYQHGERTVGELAAGLGISYGWASRVISELEEAGMVVRRPDETDRRVVHVSLAQAALETVEHAYRWRGEAVDRALSDLDAHERRVVATFLRRVTRELGLSRGERVPRARVRGVR